MELIHSRMRNLIENKIKGAINIQPDDFNYVFVHIRHKGKQNATFFNIIAPGYQTIYKKTLRWISS